MIKLKNILIEVHKIYIQKGQHVPKGKKLQTGPRGGKYFLGSPKEKIEFEKNTSSDISKEDSNFINKIKKDYDKFLGVDIENGEKYFIFQDNEDHLGQKSVQWAVRRSRLSGRDREQFYYEGDKFKINTKVGKNEKIRNDFTKTWDEFFYDEYDENMSEKEQRKKLLDKMKKNGWKYLGKASNIKLNNLKSNDALTSPESNEFYQFVLPDNQIQTSGGRGKTQLNNNSFDRNSDVWRKND